MHFMDSIFIFGLMLVLFGPKKLPEIARQAGKLMMEFRRASNDFKMQMEDELRAAEQADRQKKLEAETQAALALSTEAAAAGVGGAAEPAGASETMPTIMPPSVGETVHAERPHRMRSDAPEATEEGMTQVTPVPPVETPIEATPISAEEFYSQRQAELFGTEEISAPQPTAETAPMVTEIAKDGIAREAERVEAEAAKAVTAKLPGTEMYPDTAPMAESEQAPIQHG
jgi:TatA/E family protein of Tat protein translocase